MLLHATDQDFNEVVGKKLCIVDFYATWCGPCRMLAQEFDDILQETDKFNIVKVDVDENPELVKQFSIEAMPTLIIFKDGNPQETIMGYRTKDNLMEVMKKYL